MMEAQHSPIPPAQPQSVDLFGRTTERPWDPQGRYEGALLKVYDHWCLEVSFRQHLPGSFIIFSRHAVERYSQLDASALVELGKVTGEIEQALTNDPTLKPDRFNYLQMGNGLHHLHIHGIPRYQTPREFAGQIWTDEKYGHPPFWSSLDVPLRMVMELRAQIGEQLIKLSQE